MVVDCVQNVLTLASQSVYCLILNNNIFFKTPTAVKYILQDFKFFHSDVIISFGSASESLSFRTSLSLMWFFSARKIQNIKDIYRKKILLLMLNWRLLSKLLMLIGKLQTKQKIKNIKFIFG